MRARVRAVSGLVTVCMAAVLPWTFSGQETSARPLTGVMQGYVVTRDRGGEDVFTETDRVEPGQILEYRLVYTNHSARDLRDVSITGPIPSTTRYLADSACGPDCGEPEFSIDGGEAFQGEPVTCVRTLPDGTEAETVAPGTRTSAGLSTGFRPARCGSHTECP